MGSAGGNLTPYMSQHLVTFFIDNPEEFAPDNDDSIELAP